MHLRLLALAALALCVCNGTAFAGSTTSGGHAVTYSAKASPAKPKRATALHLLSSQATTSGERNADYARSITIDVPGFTVKPGSTPVCKESVLIANKGSGCPAGSKVGAGTAVADARPTLPNPVPATLTLYYGSDDVDANGNPQAPRPAILADAQALGVNSVYPFDISKGRFHVDLGAPPPDAKLPLFEIVQFDVTISRTVQSPSKCRGSWPSAITYAYQSGATVKATDKVACKKK